MDRGVKRDQGKNVVGLHAKRASGGAPCVHPGNESAEKLHRSLGFQPRYSPHPLRQLRGVSSMPDR
jgi:hypothetical protein